MNAAPSRPGGEPESRQVLTFVLGSETYGVDILRVQEIRGWSTVTTIPDAPPHVLGVLNLRGSIVPIIDLRKRFSLQHAQYTGLTVIIVLSVNAPAGRHDFGIVVDAVSEVVSLQSDALRPTPDLGCRAATEHILGLASLAERMVVLLDIDRLIGSQLSGGITGQPSAPAEAA